MMKKAQVFITSVKVICPNCKKPLRLHGETERFPIELSEEWDILAANKSVPCPYCHVVMLWPINPFRVIKE